MKVYGVLINGQTGETVELANVTVSDLSGVVSWSVNGSPGGKFSVVAGDGDKLVITHAGFVPITVTSESFGTGNLGVIRLLPDYKTLPDITITPQKHGVVLALFGAALLWFLLRKNKK